MSQFVARLPPFLLGAFVLCGLYGLQMIAFHLPLPPALWLIPFFLGGFCGLLIGNRDLRIKAQNHSLQQSNKRLQELVTENEERFHYFFDLNQAVQLLINPQTGRIVRGNEASQRFYGYSLNELSGKTIFDLTTAEPESIRKDMSHALMVEQLYFRSRHRLKSGEIRAVDIYTVPVPLQQRILLQSIVIDATGRDQAETDLLRKTVEQRLLLDSIPVNIWYLRDPETFGMVNRAFAESIGLTPQKTAHEKLAKVLPATMLESELAHNRQVFAGKSAVHYEQWVHTGYNEPRYMAITKTPKLDNGGSVEFVVCTATDITRMHQAGEILRVERDLHVALNETISFKETLRICLEKGLEVAQMDCGGLYLMDRAEGSLSLVVHRGLPDSFLSAASRYDSNSEQAQLVRHNQPIYNSPATLAFQIENEILQREGLHPLGIVPITFQDRVIASIHLASRRHHLIPKSNRLILEKVATTIGTFLIQKEQENLIHQHQQNLETLFNTIQDLVFILDKNGTIIYVNTAAATRLEYRQEELVGKNILAVHPADRKEEVVNIVVEMLAGKRNHSPVPLITKNGGFIPVETHVTQGQWSGQQVLFGLSRDISARLQMERQQQLLHKNKGLERMAGAMAHHFNNLMTIVAGNLELALEDATIQSSSSGLLNNALTGCKRATELGHALLLYTGQFADAVTPLNLSAFCREQFDTGRLTSPEHIEFLIDLASPGPTIVANPANLQQVLSALITNAVETIENEPGRIVVRVNSVEREDIGNVHIFPAEWVPSKDRYGCVEITDTGKGMDEGRIVNIFDPFYSDKFVGRGLGLPLALSIVKKLDGAITVTSQPGHGSTFQVLLPEREQGNPPV